MGHKGRATSDVQFLTISERVDPKPLGVDSQLWPAFWKLASSRASRVRLDRH